MKYQLQLLLLSVAALLFLCGTSEIVVAQSNMAGKRVKGFTYPEYDADGEMVWQLKGDAQFETNDRVQMRNVRLETFEKGKSKFVFVTPSCVFDRSTKNAESDAKVEVKGDHLVIEGEGFVWTGDEGKMVLRRNVRVTFTNVRKQLEEWERAGEEFPPKEEKSP
jgi:hypothetical protein